MQSVLLALLLACSLASAAIGDRAAAQTAPTAEKNDEDSLWALIKDTTNAELLRDFLEYFPNSRHAAAARARLATITTAKPPAPATPPATSAKPSAPAPAPPPATAAKPPAATATPPAPAPAASGTSTTVSRPPAPTATRPPPPSTTTTTTTTTMRAFQLFQEPRGDDNPNNPRIDWCLNWATNCGKPAADAFCKSRGFQRATSFETRLTGGPTWVAGDRRICQLPECTALNAVMCEGRDETQMIQHQTK